MRRRPLFLDDGFGVGVDFTGGVEEGVTEESQREDGEVLEGILSRGEGKMTANGVVSIFVRHCKRKIFLIDHRVYHSMPQYISDSKSG